MCFFKYKNQFANEIETKLVYFFRTVLNCIYNISIQTLIKKRDYFKWPNYIHVTMKLQKWSLTLFSACLVVFIVCLCSVHECSLNGALPCLFSLNSLNDCNITCAFSVGEYSTLKGTVILERTGRAHFYQLYGPSLAVVLVSWLALFIDEKKISPRLTVHTGCIIALITQWVGIYIIIPAVSYTRAIDVWMITHQVIIVSAFIANIVSLMARREDINKRN